MLNNVFKKEKEKKKNILKFTRGYMKSWIT